MHIEEEDCGVCEMCPDEPEEKKCPRCANGSLGLMSYAEMRKAGILEDAQRNHDSVYGCDECEYMEDQDGHRYFKKTNA